MAMSTEEMTLTERLRNPARVDGGALHEPRTIADMEEAALALEGSALLRKALMAEIERLRVNLAVEPADELSELGTQISDPASAIQAVRDDLKEIASR
jgi:hypothetical protein